MIEQATTTEKEEPRPALAGAVTSWRHKLTLTLAILVWAAFPYASVLTAQPAATITAGPNPCLIGEGVEKCRSTVTWQGDSPLGYLQVWAGQAMFGCSAAGETKSKNTWMLGEINGPTFKVYEALNCDPGTRRGDPLAQVVVRATRKPNILLILFDDMGYGDIGHYIGEPGTSYIDTPNLDRLIGEGARFTQFYANAPVCSPTRVGLLTGRYPATFNFRGASRVDGNPQDCNPATFRGIPEEIVTLPEMLREQGYVTGHAGKWHIGFSKEEFKPAGVGFDESARRLFGSEVKGLSDWKFYFEEALEIDGTTQVRTAGVHLETWLTDYSIDFIERHQDEPFFLNLWYSTPHNPFRSPPEFHSKYDPTAEGDYAARVDHGDHEVGRLLERLGELGLSDRTIVIFASDNGPKTNGKYDNAIVNSRGGLRAEKGAVFEGGIRVPFIVRWPRYVAAGRVDDTFVVGFDIYVTLAELLGVDTAGLSLDGESFLDILINPQPKQRAKPVVWEYPKRLLSNIEAGGWENKHAVRDGAWKLVNIPVEGLPMGVPALYDIEQDMFETTKLNDLYPSVVAALQAHYLQWRQDTTEVGHEVATSAGAVTLSGSELSFTGPGRVTLAEETLLDFHDGDFSFTMLIRPEAGGLASPYSLLATKPGSWSLIGFPGGKLRLRADCSSGAVTILNSDDPLVFDAWNRVTFTVTRGEAVSHLKLFINQVRQGDVVTIGDIASRLNPISLGSSGVGLANPFVGQIKDLRMFTVPLTNAEIGALAPAASP